MVTGNSGPLLGLIIWLLLTGTVKGQYYEKGQDPAFLRWKQIRTGHFRLIFPEDFEQGAQQTMNILEHSRAMVEYSLDHTPKRIPVILHNHTTESNGFVAWAPKRMELFTTPPQNIYPHDWLEQLVLHEYRHVVQVSKMNQGFTRLMSVFAGEQLPGGLAGMLGEWFLEGDAVYSETFLAPAGRGHLPSFEMELRARALEGKRFYSWDEAVLGSYKNNIPNYYQYGYQMVAYARKMYGNEVWAKSLDHVGRYPFLINPVHFSLKKTTGGGKRALFNATFHDLTRRWELQAAREETHEYSPVNLTPNRIYTEYRFPRLVLDSLILAEKSGIGQIKEFVVIAPDGSERKVHTPGQYYSVRLSARGPYITWAENMPDPRWGNRQYSVVKLFHIPTSEERQLSHKSRLFAPALSYDTRKIVAVDISLQNEYSLVLLDTKTGDVVSSHPSPGNRFIMVPEWFEGDSAILVIALDEKGKGLMSLDLNSGKWTTLLEPSYDDILSAVPHGQYIYYHSSLSGTDNIYALHTHSGKRFRITSSAFGVFDPFVDAKREILYFSEYSSQGYTIVSLHLDPSRWQAIDEVKNHFAGYAGEPENPEPSKLVSSGIPERVYEVKPYRKWMNLFGFHSWMPFYFDPDNFYLTDPDIAPGFTVFSQNTLSTTLTALRYAFRDGSHTFNTGITLKGRYPVVDLNYTFGGTVSLIKPASVDYPGGFPSTAQSVEMDISIPLNLTFNRFYRGLVPSFSTTYYNDIYYNLSAKAFQQELFSTHLRLYYYQVLKTSLRDLYPRWGNIIDLSYLFAPFRQETFNPSIKFMGIFFAPGLLRHHGLRLEGSYQEQNLEEYVFLARQEFPRGYDPLFSESLRSFRSDYVFPLLYPDMGLRGILYVKRLKGSLFFDYAENRYREWNSSISSFENFSDVLYSYGGSLTLDYNLFIIPYTINSGIRFAYLPLEKRPVTEFIFSIDIYGFSINRR